MRACRISHVIGFDDAPFARTHRGDVPVVGAVFAGNRLDGVLIDRVRRDGANAARTLIRMIRGSKFVEHLQLVMLQGIAVAGFNVVNIFELHDALALPVLVIARKRPAVVVHRFAIHSSIPEPLRIAHLIAGAIATGRSGGRV